MNLYANYKCYNQVKCKSGQFIGYIAKKGLYGRLKLIRDYVAKVEVIKNNKSYGYVMIYYKPTKMEYVFVTKEVTHNEMENYLLKLWDNMKTESIIAEIYKGKYVIEINVPLQ